jgi:hypothetical protein
MGGLDSNQRPKDYASAGSINAALKLEGFDRGNAEPDVLAQPDRRDLALARQAVDVGLRRRPPLGKLPPSPAKDVPGVPKA